MNYSLLQLLNSSTWSVDLNTFIQYQGIADAILSGAEFSIDLKPIPPYYSVNPSFEPETGSVNTDLPDSKVAVHMIKGLMLKNDAVCGPTGMKTIARNMLEADRNPGIASHVLVIESGGGQTSSIHPLKEAISKLSKPIVCFVDDQAASAGYYAASLTDHIMASQDALVGSIGVFISFSSRPKESTSSDGIVHKRIYADSSPEKNIEMEQAIMGNYSLIKENLLNPIDAKFMADIRKNRPNVTDKQLQGGILNADQCIGTLVDSIGTLEQAIDYSYSLCKPSNPKTNKMSKKNYPSIAKAASVDSFDVDADQGLHLDTSLADTLEASVSAMQSRIASFETLQEGESIQSLRDSAAIAATTLISQTEQSQAAELALNATVTDLTSKLGAANLQILAKDAEIETLSKTPPAPLTTVVHPVDAGIPPKTVDAESMHYFNLSKIGISQ